MPTGFYIRNPISEARRIAAVKANPAWLGKKRSQETKDKISKTKTGVKHTLEHRQNQSRSAKKGSANHLWKGGISPINKLIHRSHEYKVWRELVYERDNYTCQECGDRGTTLHAHHIKPFAYFPELRFEVSNGQTLCVPCHEKTDTYKTKAIKKYD